MRFGAVRSAVGSRMHVKEWRERRWRHMDSCQFKTILEASVPVVECPEHGAQTVQVPWAEESSRLEWPGARGNGSGTDERGFVGVRESAPGFGEGALLGSGWIYGMGQTAGARSFQLARERGAGSGSGEFGAAAGRGKGRDRFSKSALEKRVLNL